MNWKIKLVLLFGKLRKPISINVEQNIAKLRKKSDRAAKLGTLLFDKQMPIKSVTNVSAYNIPIRIYKNSNAKNQRTLIFYHGGGFVLYGIYSHDNVCRRLCKMNNCIVISVDYRLAPEYTYPAAHDDAFSAIKWVINNIEAHGGNPNNIVVAGDSAGGNLSACMAHRCKKENINLKAQILIYPWIDGKLNNPSIDRNGEGYLLEKVTMFWFQQKYTPQKEDRCLPALSPCYETNFDGLAPSFILTAQFDPLLDDGYKYYLQLKNAGNKTRYQEYLSLFHGFFNLPGIHPNVMKAYFDIKEFLNELE